MSITLANSPTVVENLKFRKTRDSKMQGVTTQHLHIHPVSQKWFSPKTDDDKFPTSVLRQRNVHIYISCLHPSVGVMPTVIKWNCVQFDYASAVMAASLESTTHESASRLAYRQWIMEDLLEGRAAGMVILLGYVHLLVHSCKFYNEKKENFFW